MTARVLGVIPARYGSTRLPGKPLVSFHGKPMVQWVYEAAKQVLPNLVVATDDRRIVSVVEGFGGQSMMTPKSCKSGTERMAFVAKKISADFYVNIQGDEPMMHPETIRDAVRLAIKTRGIATPAIALKPDEYNNPNCVKVVLGQDNRAVYFSRSLIPFPREKMFSVPPLKHLGLYVYPKKMLADFVSRPATKLEKTEMLEQLRALYYGMPIYVSRTRHDSIGVDTPADVRRVATKIKFTQQRRAR